MKNNSLIFVLIFTFFVANAHEYILIADHFKVKKGDTLELHLFVADGFNIETERPLQRKITKKFELITATSKLDLLAENLESSFPILTKVVDFEGLGLIHVERDYAKNILENKKFEDYLKEDYIENISINTSAKKEQKERYTRYIKCLIQSGQPNDDTLYKTIIGQQFEIILLQNPYKLKIGNKLQAKVYFQGKPLANKVITIRNRTGNEMATKQTSRTDKKGVCTFTINRKGDWFLHATQMIPCPDLAEADWESFWTSYSFGI